MNNLKIYDASRTDAAIMLSSLPINEETQLIHSNYFSILWIQQGGGNLITDFFKTKYQAGEIYCFNNYQAFSLTPELKGKAQILRFHPNFFCIETHQHEVGCNGILFNDVYDVTPILVNASLAAEVDNLLSQIAKEQDQNDHAGDELLFSYLKILLIHLTRAKSTHQLFDGQNPAAVELNQLMSLINQYATLEHQPSFYAKELNVSVKTLSKNCKKYFNKTLSNLICEKILIKAKWQLLHTDKPIKAVAAFCPSLKSDYPLSAPSIYGNFEAKRTIHE